MATEQVQNWIQNDVRLSKLIDSFEVDFANGYHFGEILRQYGYIDDLSSFSKKTNKESKVKNFAQVESFLRQLKVKFDAKLVNQIMNEERGAALRLLYQIKLSIQKDKPDLFSLEPSSQKTMTNLPKEKADKKYEDALQLKTTLASNMKYQTMNKSKKLEPIEKNLLKFEHTKKLQDDKAYQDQKAEEELIRKLLQDQRQHSLNKMTENRQFMEEWQTEGKNNWKANQQKRQDTITKQKYFEDKEVNAYKNKIMKELDEATKELMGGIDEFEKNLTKLGIEKNTNIEEAKKKMEQRKGIPPGQIQNFSYAATMNKIREGKNMQDFAAKERDRRRRKLIVDQAKTQHDLDKKKNEEQLIQKLLKSQSEEQQLAYLEWRNIQCKELVVAKRQEKAQEHQVKKEQQMVVLEQKRTEEYQAVMENHKKQIQENKRNYQELRRKEKLEKKKLNIEICSEVVDLILDVADEAFEVTSKRKNKKIEKHEWRGWMESVVNNQAVSSKDHSKSLANLLIEDEDVTRDQSQYDPLADTKKPLGDLLDEIKFDSSFEDMLEYLSVGGGFNLTPLEPEWSSLKTMNIFDDLNLDFQFLDSFVPPTNPELSSNIQSLIQNLFHEDLTEYGFVLPPSFIPHHLPFKLCLLGKKYAGKRTISKQLQELFKNLKIFRIEEIIKEAYEYANPNKIQVQQEDITKKKAPAKKGGPDLEPVFVDQYQGLDSQEFKELGLKIRNKLGDAFDFVGQSDQLVLLLGDDALLIKLFMQKLKLTYANEKSEEARVEEIKQAILKEEEIMQQLQEIEQNLATGMEKADKKGPPQKAPAKGKASAVNNEDQLKQELEQLRKVPIEGWVLLDFPKTLAQAKLFEKLFSGYTAPVDQMKSQDQRIFEQWSKLIVPTIQSPEEPKDPHIFKAATDGTLFVDMPNEECVRRTQSRKIDPTTGVIYHMEDNPPPENDVKLRDRLQEYQDPEVADQNKLYYQNMNFENEERLIKQWANGFGLKDNAVTELIVTNMMEVKIQTRTGKQEVFEKVMKHVTNILTFKQAQYDAKKAQVKLQMNQEQSQKEQQEELKDDPDVSQVADQQQQQQEEIPLSGPRSRQTAQLLQESNLSPMKLGSQQSQRSAKGPRPLTDQQKFDEWQAFENTYYRDCISVFKAVRRQRDLVFESLNETQKRFLDYLQKSDAKPGKVADFIDSFNRFSEEFPDLREDEQTKEELLRRVDQLNNDLWSSIVSKKDEALAEHQRILENGWIKHEMRKLIRYSLQIIQNELNKFNTVYKVVVGFDNPQTIQIEQQFNQAVEQGVQPYEEAKEGSGSSPILNKLISYILRVIQFQWQSLLNLENQQLSTLKIEHENLIFRLNMINTWVVLKLKEFHVFSSKVYDVLDDWVLISVDQENQSVRKLITKLQQAIYERHLRLDSSTYSIEHPLLQVELVDLQQTPSLQEQKQVYPPRDLLSLRFKAQHLESLYNDFRTYAFQNCLDASTFIHMIVLYMRQNQVPAYWRFLSFRDFNRIAQDFSARPLGHDDDKNIYSNRNNISGNSGWNQEAKREFVDWKRIITMFLLLGSQIELEVPQLYGESLREQMDENEQLNLAQFLEIPAWFDQSESHPESYKLKADLDDDDYYEEDNDHNFDQKQQQQPDLQRLKKIKSLLFMIHQEPTRTLNVGQFIESLEGIAQIVRGRTCHEALFE